MTFFKKYILLIFSALLFFSLFSCRKNSMKPLNFIELHQNNNKENVIFKNAVFDKGTFEINFSVFKNQTNELLKLKINGNTPDKYVQIFDYKTGVTVSQCSLTSNIIDSSSDTVKYMNSYEGKVIITETDIKNHLISGTFSFKIKTNNIIEEEEITKGKFIRVSY